MARVRFQWDATRDGVKFTLVEQRRLGVNKVVPFREWSAFATPENLSGVGRLEHWLDEEIAELLGIPESSWPGSPGKILD